MATVNKQAIAAAFGRAASQYEQHAELQRRSADALLAMLPQRKYARVLDAGCGPGWMSRYWRERSGQVTALDISLYCRIKFDWQIWHSLRPGEPVVFFGFLSPSQNKLHNRCFLKLFYAQLIFIPAVDFRL